MSPASSPSKNKAKDSAHHHGHDTHRERIRSSSVGPNASMWKKPSHLSQNHKSASQSARKAYGGDPQSTPSRGSGTGSFINSNAKFIIEEPRGFADSPSLQAQQRAKQRAQAEKISKRKVTADIPPMSSSSEVAAGAGKDADEEKMGEKVSTGSGGSEEKTVEKTSTPSATVKEKTAKQTSEKQKTKTPKESKHAHKHDDSSNEDEKSSTPSAEMQETAEKTFEKSSEKIKTPKDSTDSPKHNKSSKKKHGKSPKKKSSEDPTSTPTVTNDDIFRKLDFGRKEKEKHKRAVKHEGGDTEMTDAHPVQPSEDTRKDHEEDSTSREKTPKSSKKHRHQQEGAGSERSKKHDKKKAERDEKKKSKHDQEQGAKSEKKKGKHDRDDTKHDRQAVTASTEGSKENRKSQKEAPRAPAQEDSTLAASPETGHETPSKKDLKQKALAAAEPAKEQEDLESDESRVYLKQEPGTGSGGDKNATLPAEAMDVDVDSAVDRRSSSSESNNASDAEHEDVTAKDEVSKQVSEDEVIPESVHGGESSAEESSDAAAAASETDDDDSEDAKPIKKRKDKLRGNRARQLSKSQVQSDDDSDGGSSVRSNTSFHSAVSRSSPVRDLSATVEAEEQAGVASASDTDGDADTESGSESGSESDDGDNSDEDNESDSKSEADEVSEGSSQSDEEEEDSEIEDPEQFVARLAAEDEAEKRQGLEASKKRKRTDSDDETTVEKSTVASRNPTPKLTEIPTVKLAIDSARDVLAKYRAGVSSGLDSTTAKANARRKSTSTTTDKPADKTTKAKTKTSIPTKVMRAAKVLESKLPYAITDLTASETADSKSKSKSKDKVDDPDTIYLTTLLKQAELCIFRLSAEKIAANGGFSKDSSKELTRIAHDREDEILRLQKELREVKEKFAKLEKKNKKSKKD
ncbi:uncharacterized protein AB675_5906 [Cyphellophora attinorum]|uniref:Uncharacterized protein n=1 Tax=Cyphellophora attinorum TaxID=1664694 RepID=A0A0N1H2D6_9EURO|nr:uncharacterized protein AB675_5906 [Phialophora attinorum]KPI38793.1 hypothetical protein AB675_5906 [Phialophora attinorum]